MLRSLREVQRDDNVVGFYQATSLGAFLSRTLIETQAIHQDRLRHGGVVVVHGNVYSLMFNMLLTRPPDISHTAGGMASFRAFKLTSSFIDAHKKANFNTTRWVGHMTC